MKHSINYRTEKGSVMLMVLIMFSVLLILGTSILTIVMAENSFTGIDSENQSAYYVAESGANYVIKDIITGIEEIKMEIEDEEENDIEENSVTTETYGERFFSKFNDRYVNKNYTISNFEKNNGEQPISKISISLGEHHGEYKVKSLGAIGDNIREVSSIVTLGWIEPEIEIPSNPIIEDLLFYTTDFSFGGSFIDWKDGTAVLGSIEDKDINGGANLQISNIYFDGNVNMDGGNASFGNRIAPGTIFANGNLKLWTGARDVWGDVRVKGDFMLKDAKLHGNVFVEGNVELGWKPFIDKNIYYTGNLVHPKNYNQNLLNKCIKVESIDDWEVPISKINLREDQWYINNGYDVKGNVNSTVPDNARLFVSNYNYTNWPKWNVNDGVLKDVVIVSKGDIILNTATEFTGALIAPNGIVELPQGGTTFKGIIVSKNSIQISGGGSKIYFDELKNIFSESNIPFIFGEYSGGSDEGGPGNGKPVNIGSFTINISGIKEN